MKIVEAPPALSATPTHPGVNTSPGQPDQVTSRIIALFSPSQTTQAAAQGSPAEDVTLQTIEYLLRRDGTEQQSSLAQQIIELIGRSSNPHDDSTLHQQVHGLLQQSSDRHPGRTYAQLIGEILKNALSAEPPASRARRSASLNVITSDAQKKAEYTVRKADSDLAAQFATSLMERVISLEPRIKDRPEVKLIDNIAPHSTFGQAWSRLTQALRDEPFASYARKNQIDTSHFKLNPRSGWLECTINGRPANFTTYTPGWDAASADVVAAARKLAPTLKLAFEYAGEHTASFNVVGDFYGANYANTRADTLYFIGQLQCDQGFPSVVYPKSELPYYNQPAHLPIKQLQQDAIDTLAAQITPSPGPCSPTDKTASQQIAEGDLYLARWCGRTLIARHKETRPKGAGILSATGWIPEHSTMGQVHKSFENALAAPAFLTFVQNNQIDISSVSIAAQTGELHCQVTGANGVKADKVFSPRDESGWSAVGADIWTCAKSLAAGSTARLRHPLYSSISSSEILTFYGENPQEGTLLETLKRCVALNRSGFPALREDNPLSALQEKRRAAIERLDNPPNRAKAKPTATPNPTAEIARRQFAGEPGLHSVVGRLLTDAIKRASPALDFDINRLDIATPDPQQPGVFKRRPLIDLALDYLLDDAAPDLPANSRLLDARPDLLAHTGNTPAVPLPVEMNDLQSALRALPGQLNQALDTDVREYWNQPAFSAPASGGISPFTGSRRTLISNLLRDNLQLSGLKQPGLDEQQRETLDLVVRYPDDSTRPTTDNSELTVFSLGSISAPNQGSIETLSPNLLIQRHIGNRAILLLCEPSGKVTPYESYAAFDAARAGQLRAQSPGHRQLTLLRKVDGNAFDSQANTLITERLDDRLAPDPTLLNLGNLDQPQRKMPGWVSKATEAERFVLRELSLQLASITQRNKGRTYNSDIPDIRPFAEETFDQLQGSGHPAKNLEVVFKVPVGGNSPGGVVSGSIHRERMSMTDVLLRNLSGLPSRAVEVYLKPGNTRVPELEKDGELQALIQRVDIGRNYPELLKRELLDDPTKKAERQSLFARQVPVELQIKALELAVQKQSGFDTTGLRYVQAAVSAQPGPKTVDGKDIVVRPLAFIAGPGSIPDVVDNMYLIEPEDHASGPHILYRPLIADAPLLQFPTRQALLEAVQKPGRLQKDILAWFPNDTTREYYKAWSFQEPSTWTTSLFGAGDGETVPAAPTLAVGGYAAADALKAKLQAGQWMNHLYDANAQGLASIAQQQSVSDDESRWATLKEGGYLLLNAVLPALRGPGAAIGLALQYQGILSDLQTLAYDKENKEPAMADLLLNLAMLATHFRARSLPGQAGTALTDTPLRNGRYNSIIEAPNGEKVRRLIVMKGNMKKMQLVKGDLFTFEDEYKGKPRLNINAHGRDLSFTEQLSGKSSTILYDGAEHTPAQLRAHLQTKGIDPSQFDNVRLLVCYSGNGAENSFAAEFQRLINKPVKAFIGTVTVTPSPELVSAEFQAGIQLHGPQTGPALVSDTYAQYDSVDTVKDRTGISLIRNPLEYVLFTYSPVYYPPRTGATAANS